MIKHIESDLKTTVVKFQNFKKKMVLLMFGKLK